MNSTLKHNVSSIFKSEFKTEPKLIFSPGRINLIGEHTDYNDGFVFPAAIDKGIYLAIEKSNTKSSKVIAIDGNDSYEFTLEDLQPITNGGWKNYVLGVIAEIQNLGRSIEPVNIVFSGDIPIGAGLSSSAALENAVVFGLNTIFNLGLTKEEMIHISQKAEHHFVGVNCGIMDQYASMFGQKDTALLLDCKTLETTTHKVDFGDYSLLLINTNVSHNLADSEYNKRRASCERAARALGKDSLRSTSKKDLLYKKSLVTNDDFNKALYVLEENERVKSAALAISNNDLKQLGQLLYQSHEGLSKHYKVSCSELDFLVSATTNNPDILGARMMGGGFGGCTINLIKTTEIAGFTKNIASIYIKEFHQKASFYQVNLSQGTHLLA
jgi:galactokinase